MSTYQYGFMSGIGAHCLKRSTAGDSLEGIKLLRPVVANET